MNINTITQGVKLNFFLVASRSGAVEANPAEAARITPLPVEVPPVNPVFSCPKSMKNKPL
jgi:hypothetical protein